MKYRVKYTDGKVAIFIAVKSQTMQELVAYHSVGGFWVEDGVATPLERIQCIERVKD